MKKIGKKGSMLFIIVAVVTLLLSEFAETAKAGLYEPDNDMEVKMEEGKIYFRMTAKEKSSNTFFRTVGFIVTEEVKSGNKLTTEEKKHYFYLKDTGHNDKIVDLENCQCTRKDTISEGMVFSDFVVCEDCVYYACQQGGEELNYNKIKKKGGNIYFHGIIDVFVNGKLKATCTTYDAVTALGVFGSGTLGDIQQRYNVEVPYDPMPATVEVTRRIYDPDTGKYEFVVTNEVENYDEK